ncbi:putative WD repeat-containing protein all2124 [Talaromyces islandicus]|uniref:Mitochondrial division protein 1 n=1 Tax=Talaromyces islandicus TaxID=28573 RepID=A0A0U1M2I7_TALIS|nr:putative WD repeat-containing protein all2124 [Talaromyces islandicus]
MSRTEQENPDSTDRYTVGWICALEEEYECACRMLDEEFSGPEIDDKDENTYVYGRVANHHVVIGCLPAGRYGTNSAATVARDMVRSFPHLRFALIVGIGGGAPTKDKDIRLGDVVVSQPRDGFGGVIQYDLGKKLQDGRFQKTGQLNAPSAKLLGVIPEMRRRYNDKRKSDRIAEHLQRMDEVEYYQRPMVDQLYRTEYQHVGGKGCGQCDPNRIVERPERRVHRTIAVHYGTIASGNTVMKDATLRDTYANDPELNVLCFEMEAAGLMNSLPCLVIRGICDYCDSHKNDDWHKYAALTAAAYARELLLVLKPQRVEAMPSWAEQVVDELQQVRQDGITIINNQSIIKNRVDTIGQKIDWANLPVVDGAEFDSYMDQHENECLPGTRIALRHQIAAWAASPQGKCIFWLNGMAGTGKSTISRTVAKSFKRSMSLGASFFFKRGEGDRGNAKNFFPTIVRQLANNIPQLIPGVTKAIHEEPNITAKSLKEQFNKLLLQPLLGIKQFDYPINTKVIVVDALDECEREEDVRVILQLLPQVHMSSFVQLRFFLTSRPELPIRLGFKDIINDYQDFILHKVPRPVIEHDISLYFEDKFLRLRQERSLPSDWPGNETIKILVERAGPLFISAATLCRFIGDAKWNPERRLRDILTDQATYVSKMDKIYMPILNQLLTGQDEWDSRQLIQEFKEIVGAIILLADPLPVNALALLLNIGTLEGHADTVQSVAFSPNGKLLASGSSDETIKLWDTATGVLQQTLMAHSDWVESVVFSPDNRLLASASDDKTIKLWDIATGILQQSLLGHLDTVQYIVFSSNGRLLVSGSDDKTIKIWDTATGALEHTLIAHSDWVESVAFSPDDQLLASGSRDKTIKFWNIATGALQKTLTGHLDWVESVAFSQDGRLLASGSRDETIKLWDATTEALLYTLAGHLNSVQSVVFSPDGRLLASASNDETIKLWDIATGTLQRTLLGHSYSVQSVVFSPDGRMLASGSDDKTIKIWDITSRVPQHTHIAHSDWVESVAFSPDGQLLASGSRDKKIKLWDTTTEVFQQTLEGHLDTVQSIAFSPNGRLLASGSRDGAIKLWDTVIGVLQHTLTGHLDSVWSVAFSSDGRLLASGSRDKTIKLWDTATGSFQQNLPGHLTWIYSVVFSPDNRLLASSSDDRTVKLWETATGTLQQILTGHLGSVWSIAFSPDGRLLASGSRDGTIKLWDTTTGALQQTLAIDVEVTKLKFSEDSPYLCTNLGFLNIRPWYNNCTTYLSETNVEVFLREEQWVTLQEVMGHSFLDMHLVGFLS